MQPHFDAFHHHLRRRAGLCTRCRLELEAFDDGAQWRGCGLVFERQRKVVKRELIDTGFPYLRCGRDAGPTRRCSGGHSAAAARITSGCRRRGIGIGNRRGWFCRSGCKRWCRRVLRYLDQRQQIKVTLGIALDHHLATVEHHLAHHYLALRIVDRDPIRFQGRQRKQRLRQSWPFHRQRIQVQRRTINTRVKLAVAIGHPIRQLESELAVAHFSRRVRLEIHREIRQ